MYSTIAGTIGLHLELDLSLPESLSVFAGDDEGFNHLRIYEVAVELV